MLHLSECNFQLPTRDTRDREIVTEIVACFVQRLQGKSDLPWEPEKESVVLDCLSASSSCGSEGPVSDLDPASKGKDSIEPSQRKRRKTADEKRKAVEAEKAAKLKDLKSKGVEGKRWKGFIYIHPSCRSFWVKVGLSEKATRRAAGQNSTTFGPDSLVRKVEVDLGDMSTTTPKQRLKRLKNVENLSRLILRNHHHHRKREVPSHTL